ncbi:FAD:protein FMN transferase [Pseudomonas sp. 5P_3.1_Bac2]|uniref:FAD:protein FMN transferase n=1 Tax=Pseudomonas sp. 5P_3.1_Bac2 TaxID=2971617 RepID=UPI0021CA30C2|nr:FAD:protein FMN transferase [Pseudomonas sp. 5P_3.1_Bac2]MCU1716594.1 FAD:protein FMN transferase [Pseudomonas sp. 5P_3.1_Bac2]
MIHLFVRPVIVVSLLAALTGCWFSERIEEFGGPTMGSTYSIKYVHTSNSPSLEQLKEETQAILAEVDEQMSTYRNDSLIEQFNQAPAGTCQTMPAAVLELLQLGRELHEQSQGAFDLTLEPLLDLWGFGPKAQAEQVPSPAQVAAARARTGMQYLRSEGQQLCKDADVQLDFNSIAAGYTVDRITQRLEQLAVTSYLVEVTGELKASGLKPDGQPWRIGIEAPQSGERVAQRVLALNGYGVSTSGDYRNYFEEGGRRYSHTLDPTTGAPIEHKLAAVTVVDRSTLRADGLSTLLMVLGEERGWQFAQQHGIAAFFVSRADDAFVTRGTKAFEQLFAEGKQQ